MNRILAFSVSCLVLLAPAAVAQNRLAHFDGTAEGVSRGGGLATDVKSCIQRMPGDQCCGATLLKQISVFLQDFNTATPELVTIEVRRNNPALNGTPDMSPAGLISATPPFVPPFPGIFPTEAIIANLNFTAPGLLLPSSSSAAGDWYLCVILPPAPIPPPGDGIYIGTSAALPGSAGEQMEPTALGYTGAANVSGLAWDYNVTTGLLVLGSFNRSWNIVGRYAEDTLQPFASSPAFTGVAGNGLDPNFGYAGIWPHLSRVVGAGANPDDIGFRCLSSMPVGSTCIMAASLFVLGTPVGLGPVAFPGSAKLCLDTATLLILETKLTTAPPFGEPATSQAVFGPYNGVGLDGLGTFYFQGAIPFGAQVKLTTLCKVVF